MERLRRELVGISLRVQAYITTILKAEYLIIVSFGPLGVGIYCFGEYSKNNLYVSVQHASCWRTGCDRLGDALAELILIHLTKYNS